MRLYVKLNNPSTNIRWSPSLCKGGLLTIKFTPLQSYNLLRNYYNWFIVGDGVSTLLFEIFEYWRCVENRRSLQFLMIFTPVWGVFLCWFECKINISLKGF